MSKQEFFLIGTRPARAFREGGPMAVTRDDMSEGDLFHFIHGQTTASELMSAFNGYNDYVDLTEEEHNMILDMLNSKEKPLLTKEAFKEELSNCPFILFNRQNIYELLDKFQDVSVAKPVNDDLDLF